MKEVRKSRWLIAAFLILITFPNIINITFVAPANSFEVACGPSDSGSTKIPQKKKVEGSHSYENYTIFYNVYMAFGKECLC